MAINTKQNTIYDWALVSMMALLAFGSSFGFWQPIRIMFLLLMPCMVYDVWKTKDLKAWKGHRYELIFFGIWILWSGVSLYWREDGIECIKLFIHLIIYVSGWMEVMWLSSKAQRPIRSIALGWIIMFLASVPVAVWELLTDHHLPTCETSAGALTYISEHVAIRRWFAATTFDNLNACNNTLCFTLLSVTMWLYQADKKWEKILGVVTWIMVGAIIYQNGSRAALACLICSAILYIIMANTRMQRWTGGLIIGLTILWTGICYTGWIPQHTINTDGQYVAMVRQGLLPEDRLVIADGKIIGITWDDPVEKVVTSTIANRIKREGARDVSRPELFRIAWAECNSSYFMGVGMGNVPPAMARHDDHYRAPHCLWLEMLMEFGIVLFIGFLGLWAIQLVRGWKQGKEGLRPALMGLMLLAGTSLSDGTVLFKAQTWMFWATLMVMVAYATTWKKTDHISA